MNLQTLAVGASENSLDDLFPGMDDDDDDGLSDFERFKRWEAAKKKKKQEEAER